MVRGTNTHSQPSITSKWFLIKIIEVWSNEFHKKYFVTIEFYFTSRVGEKKNDKLIVHQKWNLKVVFIGLISKCHEFKSKVDHASDKNSITSLNLKRASIKSRLRSKNRGWSLVMSTKKWSKIKNRLWSMMIGFGLFSIKWLSGDNTHNQLHKKYSLWAFLRPC